MAKAKDNSMHWIIGIVLLITGVLIIAALVVTYSQGQLSNTGNFPANVNINNEGPVIDMTSYGTSHQLYEDNTPGTLALGGTVPGVVGGGVNIFLNVNVSDSNGYDNQTINVSGRMVRTLLGSNGLQVNTDSETPFTFDNGTDYTSSLPVDGSVACTKVPGSEYDAGGGANTGATWTCGPVTMYYLSDPTAAGTSVDGSTDYSSERWNFLVEASDGTTTASDYTTTYFEYPNIIGLAVDALLELGSTTTDGVTETDPTNVNVENKGNQQLDIALEVNQQDDAAAWNCTGGGYPLVSDLHHHESLTTYASMDPLVLNQAGTGTLEGDFDLVRATDIAVASADTEKFVFATSEPVGAGYCTLSSIVFTATIGYP